PHKAAPILRRIMNDLYTTDKTGLCGNEDVGQMSAWFVMSSIGLYQVEPTGGRFVFGSPLFKSATINVGNGKTLQVNAVNNSTENIYIQSVTLNGEPYGKSYIDFAQIKNGGVLEFVMASSPAPDYGRAPESRP
ncbi:MAG: glycoside hydrolase family 92 protein, partial [Muribaculaceae bacterium]|nr:glycoside hydrolase family 92 protein [Muribaculaceae bacterium]